MDLNPQIGDLQLVLDDYLKEKPDVSILEAGCGSSTKMDLPPHARIIGIDISQKQLDRNAMLSEKILGDIQSFPLPSGRFDMVISWFVLEHVAEPLKALENFATSLKSNGLIVLALPNVFSLKGFVTKLTPHFVHVIFYRYILGHKDAGRHDTVPFPTYLRYSLAPQALKKYAEENKLFIKYYRTYDGKMQQKLLRKNAVFRGFFWVVGGFVKLVSWNTLDVKNNNFAIVLQKQ
jgi:SAM-dependent methyltransferase